MIKTLPIILRIVLKHLPLILFILGLSYCTLSQYRYLHLEQLADDDNTDKTLLIYPTAGRFIVDTTSYFGKKSGDSYFTFRHPLPDPAMPARLYTIVGKYRKVHYMGTHRFNDNSLDRYLVRPVEEKINKRLFLLINRLEKCKKPSNLNDPETGIKIDFICD